MEQNPIYCDTDVVITFHLARIFGVSYPIRAISSIKIGQRKTAKRPSKSLFLMLGGVFTLCGLGVLSSASGELWWIGVVFGGLLVSMGFMTFAKGFRYKLPPPVFELILVTNAREGVVMASENHTYIEHVRGAIEQAIIGKERVSPIMEVTPVA